VDPSQLRRRKSQKNQFEAFLQRGNGTRVNTAALTLHRGGKSCLHEIEDSSLQHIFEEREQGLVVSIRMVILKASQLQRSFHNKTERAKDLAVRRFVRAHDIKHRVHTRQSHESLAPVQSKAKDWIEMMRPRLIRVNRDKRFIINMDQTSIFQGQH
jgi:hypothetical protein